MATETKAQDIWPLKFFYRLDWEGQTARFQEVDGLDHETPETEFRDHGAAQFFKHKLPGLKQDPTVTLKRGIAASNFSFGPVGPVPEGEIKRSDATISLMDAAGEVLQVWTLKNAWPVKSSVDALKAEDDETSVEAMEFRFEEVTMEQG